MKTGTKSLAVYTSYDEAERRFPIEANGGYVFSRHNTDPENGMKYVDFRVVSARPIAMYRIDGADFSHNGGQVLKAAVKLLPGTPVKVDHSGQALASIGQVVGAWWQDAYTTAEGVEVPAGINARFAIPRWGWAIDKIEEGTVKNVSASFKYEWVPSNPEYVLKAGAENFFKNLGQEIDGKILAKYPTVIQSFVEVSLVEMGADTAARVLCSDQSIDMTSIAYFSQDQLAKLELKNTLAKDVVSTYIGDGIYESSINTAVMDPKGTETENIAKYQEQLNSAKEEVAKLAGQLSERENALKVAEATSSKFSEQVEQLSGELATQKAELAKVMAEATAQKDQVAKFTEQVAKFTEEVSQLTKENEELKNAQRKSLVENLEKAYIARAVFAETPATDAQVAAYKDMLSGMSLSGLESLAKAEGFTLYSLTQAIAEPSKEVDKNKSTTVGSIAPQVLNVIS